MSEKNSPWRSPWVIGWLGLLILFFLFSGVRIWFAIDSNPGLVVDDFYERGEDLSANRLKREARNPGWQMEIEAPAFVDIAKPTLFGFRVKNNVGKPIDPDAVIFYAYRPADKSKDFSVPMRRVATGHYTAEVSFPLLGVWDILVSAKNGQDEYNMPHRISAGVK
jgi:nitrogen fixation protein FixH